MGTMEGNVRVDVHYAGGPNAGAPKPSVAPGTREYKLARLPNLVVEGRANCGFSVKGFQVPPEATIMAFLGEGLFRVIGKWPDADQTRAVHNLIAFVEENKPQVWGARRGIQQALNELMGGLIRVKIGFDTRGHFDPELEPQAMVAFGVDMELNSPKTGGRWGEIEISDGRAKLRYIPVDTKLPAEDLEAILRFQGK